MKKLILLFCLFIGWSVASAAVAKSETDMKSAKVATITQPVYITVPASGVASQSNPVVKIIYYFSAFMTVWSILILTFFLVVALTGPCVPIFELHSSATSTLIWGTLHFLCKKILGW